MFRVVLLVGLLIAVLVPSSREAIGDGIERFAHWGAEQFSNTLPDPTTD